jgi:tetratricopeptide (TPR) repeat protein
MRYDWPNLILVARYDWAMNSRRNRLRLHGLIAISVLAACTLPPPYHAPERQPAPDAREPSQPVPQPAPEPSQELPPAPKAREYTLSPAAKALLSQAQTQVASGNYPLAAGAIERALRIEPENPLLWIEMAKVRLAENNNSQAENLARKALSRATGDTRAQAAAWKVIADSYRGRGRMQEAHDADTRAATLTTQ